VAKIIIDESELIDQKGFEVLEKLARFFDRLDDPYRMPDTMAEWIHKNAKDHGVDTYFSVPVGFSGNAMQLRFTFKKNMMIMEFTDPYGMRLMELRFHD
jgi:hypothetical protein